MKTIYLVLALMAFLPATAQNHHSKHRSCTDCEQQTQHCQDCCCTVDTMVDCFDGTANYYKGYQKMTPKDIIYDFKTGIFLLPPGYNRLKVGDWVRVRVIHFNPLLFGVSVNSKDSVQKTVVDASNALSFLLNPANLSGLMSGLGTPVTAPGQVVPNFQLAFKDLQNFSKWQQAKPDGLDAAKEYLENAYKDIQKLQADAITLEHDFEAQLHIYNKSLAVLKERYPDCRAFEYAGSDEFRDELESFFTTHRAKVDDEMQTIQSAETKYVLGTSDVVAGVLTVAPIRVEDSLIKSYYTASLAYLSKLDSNLSEKMLDSLQLALHSFKYMKPCFTSGSLLYTKDIKTITLAFRAWADSAHNYVTSPDPLQLPIVQQKAWGVSAGMYVSTLHNQEYTSKLDANDANYHLIGDNTGSVEIGVDALAYLGLKTWPATPGSTNYNYFGINYGAGISLESTPKPRILAGLGYVYGGANRIVASAGFIAGFVDRLSSAYGTATAYTAAQTGYIKRVLSPGLYLSLNYSFIGN